MDVLNRKYTMTIPGSYWIILKLLLIRWRLGINEPSLYATAKLFKTMQRSRLSQVIMQKPKYI